MSVHAQPLFRRFSVVLVSAIISTAAIAMDAKSGAELSALFADERAALWHFDPLTASSEGNRDSDDRLPSVSPADQERWATTNRTLLKRLKDIDTTSLSEQERISATLMRFILEQRLQLLRYQEWRLPFNSDSGFYVELLYLHQGVPLRTEQDYRNYLSRLRDFPRYFDQQIANLRLGLRSGFTLPSEVLGGVAKVIDGVQFKNVDDCPLYQPFTRFPASFAPELQQSLRNEGLAVLEQQVLPSYRSFAEFFHKEYRPGARRSLGASDLPQGKAYYRDLARYFTTLPDADPEQIHQLGLSEVARIRAEMDAIIETLEFKGSFADFLHFLRNDKQFYAENPTALIREAAHLSKTIDGKLPEYFRVLPRTPYTVKPVPAALAPNYTAGRYNPGPMGAAGEYWVNTYALHTRPLYALPALTLHEAVPGHHLQGALARELEAMPLFRLSFYPHAFGEGWALYTEKLGKEMGVYETPYQDFGRLSYEMWRASRLVVDTGIHAKGWSRDQARSFLSEQTALSEHEIATEVDRYISWPGQALAYKIGELEILKLRERAESALAEHFDIRDFHSALLANGGVTLPVLQQQVDAFIAAARQRPPAQQSRTR